MTGRWTRERKTARRAKTLVRSLVAAVVAIQGGVAPPAGSQTVEDPNLQVETVATGLNLPTNLDFLAANDILVLERATGAVRRILDGVLLATPVLVLPVHTGVTSGLLGIAINTADPPDVFLALAEDDDADGIGDGLRLYRYTWNPTLGVLESPLLLLDLSFRPASNHHGGVLVLGPPGEAPGVGDGALLYFVVGDIGQDGLLGSPAAARRRCCSIAKGWE